MHNLFLVKYAAATNDETNNPPINSILALSPVFTELLDVPVVWLVVGVVVFGVSFVLLFDSPSTLGASIESDTNYKVL